jgi:hypothetical protein
MIQICMSLFELSILVEILLFRAISFALMSTMSTDNVSSFVPVVRRNRSGGSMEQNGGGIQGKMAVRR